MSDEECIHGIPEAFCTYCNGREKREAVARAEQPRTFRASYDGQCPGCNLPIVRGQMVAWLPERQATHEECWS